MPGSRRPTRVGTVGTSPRGHREIVLRQYSDRPVPDEPSRGRTGARTTPPRHAAAGPSLPSHGKIMPVPGEGRAGVPRRRERRRTGTRGGTAAVRRLPAPVTCRTRGRRIVPRLPRRMPAAGSLRDPRSHFRIARPRKSRAATTTTAKDHDQPDEDLAACACPDRRGLAAANSCRGTGSPHATPIRTDRRIHRFATTLPYPCRTVEEEPAPQAAGGPSPPSAG